MSLNVHPIFVHFPIALLTLYAVLEFLPFAKARKSQGMTAIKLFLLFVGEAGTVAAGLTGKLAAQDAYDNPTVRYPKVIETHSFFAELTFIIFGILTLMYLAQLATQYYRDIKPIRALGVASQKYYVAAPLALIGLLAVTITGAMGGIVVYGPNMDPVTQLVYHLLIR